MCNIISYTYIYIYVWSCVQSVHSESQGICHPQSTSVLATKPEYFNRASIYIYIYMYIYNIYIIYIQYILYIIYNIYNIYIIIYIYIIYNL